MNQSGRTIPNAVLLALLGGATLGSFAIAFSTTQTGKKLKNSLIALAGRFNPKAGGSGPMDDETVQAAFASDQNASHGTGEREVPRHFRRSPLPRRCLIAARDGEISPKGRLCTRCECQTGCSPELTWDACVCEQQPKELG